MLSPFVIWTCLLFAIVCMCQIAIPLLFPNKLTCCSVIFVVWFLRLTLYGVRSGTWRWWTQMNEQLQALCMVATSASCTICESSFPFWHGKPLVKLPPFGWALWLYSGRHQPFGDYLFVCWTSGFKVWDSQFSKFFTKGPPSGTLASFVFKTMTLLHSHS